MVRKTGTPIHGRKKNGKGGLLFEDGGSSIEFRHNTKQTSFQSLGEQEENKLPVRLDIRTN